MASLQVEVELEYVPEKAELDDALLADFKEIFGKFTFKDAPAATEVIISVFSAIAIFTNLDKGPVDSDVAV